MFRRRNLFFLYKKKTGFFLIIWVGSGRFGMREKFSGCLPRRLFSFKNWTRWPQDPRPDRSKAAIEGGQALGFKACKVLGEYVNMSSPCVLLILDRSPRPKSWPPPVKGSSWAAPGLTSETVVLRSVPNSKFPIAQTTTLRPTNA